MYFITMLRDKDGDREWRTIAMFDDFDTAKLALVNQMGDPFENGWYKYAIISRMSTGLYKSPKRIATYRVVRDEVELCPDNLYIDFNDFYIIG